MKKEITRRMTVVRSTILQIIITKHIKHEKGMRSVFQQLWKFTFLTCVLGGCAVFGNVQPSGDYVPIAGLVCNSPEMVDGDMATRDFVYIEGSIGVGERNQGIGAMRLDSPVAHLVAPTTVQLPKRSEVGMIVLYGEHLVDFNVLAKEGEKWKELRRFRKNSRKRIMMTTSVVTDTIRIIAIKGVRGSKNPRSTIQEIEVYVKSSIPPQ